MPKKPTYIKLPIYSVTTFRNFIYFSGGGGGKTGIPNEIFIYQNRVTQQPVNKISTGSMITQNMVTNGKDELMICSANQNIILYSIEESGKSLSKLYEFEADFSFKNATINAICMHPALPIFASGGDDKVVRFYNILNKGQSVSLSWSHEEHENIIRNIDNNSNSLFVSADLGKAVLIDLDKQQIIRTFYGDTLKPIKSIIQAAYFLQQNPPGRSPHPQTSSPSLVICHYINRKNAYITKQLSNGMLETVEVSKDQSCLASKNNEYVGIGCGNGTTYMIDVNRMKCVSREKAHNFVITAGLITRGNKFITATPECSYFIQEINDMEMKPLLAGIMVLLTVVLMHLQQYLSSSLSSSDYQL